MNPKPQSQVFVAYVIPNPAEVATFYPQAVVKNTQTGAVVATVNLVQDANNSLRYTGSFMSPADSTGMGYYLDVITIPYTDAGHSVPSQNYWAATAQYFVYQSPANYGGGYMDVFGKEFERVLKKHLSQIKFPKQKDIKFPEFPAIPAAQRVDLEPTNKLVKDAMKAVAEFRALVEGLPKFKETNHSTVLGSIGASRGDILRKMDEVTGRLESVMTNLPTQVREDVRVAIATAMQTFEQRLNAMIEKGIPIRSAVFQEEGQRQQKPKSLAEMQQELSSNRPRT